MLSRLNNEVLMQGPSAVLPQNLSAEWLEALLQAAETFLDTTYDLEECRTPTDDADPMLIACVTEISSFGNRTGTGLSTEEMAERLTVYCLSLILESASRDYGLPIRRPDLEGFFSWDRIRELGKSIPEFTELLEKACMLNPPKPNWADSVKKKLLAGIRGISPPQPSA